jgi:CheY-like chemotaxis protein
MVDTNRISVAPVRTIAVVNGGTDVLGMLETVFVAGRYDVVFVESSDDAYSQIRKVLPSMVILCARIEDLDGFQLLTMLKLDPDTRDIPVLTCMAEHQSLAFDAAVSLLAERDEDWSPSGRSPRMN